jgi:hypothetical protein
MTDRIFEAGGDLITDTAVHTGRWRKLVALADVVLDSGTVADDISGSFSGAQLKATAELIGTFTSIQLTSGTAVAYF